MYSPKDDRLLVGTGVRRFLSLLARAVIGIEYIAIQVLLSVSNGSSISLPFLSAQKGPSQL